LLQPKILRAATKVIKVYLPNNDGTYTEAIQERDDSLRLVINDVVIGLSLGGALITDESSFYAKTFAGIDALELPAGSKVAHLGGGMGWLPKMLLGYGLDQVIFELDPDICTFLNEGILGGKVAIIPGDYKANFDGLWDVIIYDIDEPVDIQELKKHLTENGKVYSL
jgi:hypothetical protein